MDLPPHPQPVTPFTHCHRHPPQSYTGNFATDLCKGVFLTPLPLTISTRNPGQDATNHQRQNDGDENFPQGGEDARKVSFGELQSHASQSRKDIWVAIHGIVYDISNFLDKHPGGSQILLYQAGTDATEIFDLYHGEMGESSLFISKYSPPVKVVGILTKGK